MSDEPEQIIIHEGPDAFLGQHGFENLSGETGTTEYIALQVEAGGATFEATVARGEALPSVARAEGVIIYGPFLTVVVTVGTVIAYLRPPTR